MFFYLWSRPPHSYHHQRHQPLAWPRGSPSTQGQTRILQHSPILTDPGKYTLQVQIWAFFNHLFEFTKSSFLNLFSRRDISSAENPSSFGTEGELPIFEIKLKWSINKWKFLIRVSRILSVRVNLFEVKKVIFSLPILITWSHPIKNKSMKYEFYYLGRCKKVIYRKVVK